MARDLPETPKTSSISLLLLDGDPDGLRQAEISMSPIRAYAFPSTEVSRVKSVIDIPGVYVLLGTDERKAYIGESLHVAGRLPNHSRDESKSFWTDTIVFVSTNDALTSAHVKYVEARLVRATHRNPRWKLPQNMPAKNAGHLPTAERVAMNTFAEQSMALTGVLGCDLFRPELGSRDDEGRAGSEAASIETFEFRGGGFSAKMKLSPNGRFIVLAGSLARTETTRAIPDSAAALRRTLAESGVLTEREHSLGFSADYMFSSVSSAAAVVCGTSVNGRKAWKLADGRSYWEWEAEQQGTSESDG